MHQSTDFIELLQNMWFPKIFGLDFLKRIIKTMFEYVNSKYVLKNRIFLVEYQIYFSECQIYSTEC